MKAELQSFHYSVQFFSASTKALFNQDSTGIRNGNSDL